VIRITSPDKASLAKHLASDCTPQKAQDSAETRQYLGVNSFSVSTFTGSEIFAQGLGYRTGPREDLTFAELVAKFEQWV
jgi:hypothetical protein